MNGIPFKDCVAIDTNVFLHVLNCQNNPDSHINELLQYLSELGTALLVDDQGQIAGEYEHQLGPMLRNADDTLNERYILNYWMHPDRRQDVRFLGNDQLIAAIKQVIHEKSETVDRRLVYVAFKVGKTLISNDEMHIVVGPTKERRQGPRRTRLLNSTRRLRPNGADILTSQEAHAAIS